MIKFIKKIYSIILKIRKIQLASVFALTVLTAFFEIVSIGSIIPFISAISNPEAVNNIYLIKILILLNIKQVEISRIQIITIFAILAFISGILKIILSWTQMQLSFNLGTDFSVMMLKNALTKPYEMQLNSNSSDTISAILKKSDSLIYNAIQPGLILASSILLACSILFTLILINTNIAISTIATFTLIYFIIIKITKKILSKSSKLITSGIDKGTRILQESLNTVREIILDSNYSNVISAFENNQKQLNRENSKVQFIVIGPKYAIETLGIIFICIIMLVLNKADKDSSDFLPIIGVLVISAQRLLPLLQNIYASITSIRGGSEIVKDALSYLEMPNYKDALSTKIIKKNNIYFNSEVKLNNISYSYPSNINYIFEDLSLSIVKGSKIGIIGATGEGKSTLLDIILKLLESKTGSITVDNVKINQVNLSDYHSLFAYVSQDVYLHDTTIFNNITGGAEVDNQTSNKVIEACIIAEIHEKIMSMPQGYQTTIGENAIKISGGEKQRIAIARAIYKNKNILIFDESTSALDIETEKCIIKNIETKLTGITIIMVAHRLETLKICNHLYKLSGGKLIELAKD